MKHLTVLLSRVSSVVKQYARPGLSVGLVVILVAATVIILVPGSKQGPDNAVTPDKVAKVANTEIKTESPETAPPAEQQDNAANTASTAPSSGRQTGGKRYLTISPSTITVVANNQSAYYYAASFNVSSSNGKGINMPMFTSYQQDKFMLNFPAGPAKTNWTGDIMIYKTTPPGSYAVELFAQDNSTAEYRGVVTIQIVEPTLNISIQSHGYNAEYDALMYTVKLDRLYGFSEKIEQVAVYDTTEPTFTCYYVEVDSSTIDLYCGNEEDPRPTNGTFKVEVATSSVAKSVSTSYSLPPLP